MHEVVEMVRLMHFIVRVVLPWDVNKCFVIVCQASSHLYLLGRKGTPNFRIADHFTRVTGICLEDAEC